jgi:hypothetical protein
MKYKTLKELKAAYDAKEITEPLMLDNDCTFVYVGDEKVFEGGLPDRDLLPEALDLLGIPNEGV